MMTAKEKALDICEKMGFVKGEIMGVNYLSKQYSLILVDEMIHELTKCISPSVHGFRHNYWEEVKHEIEKLYLNSINEALDKLKQQ